MAERREKSRVDLDRGVSLRVPATHAEGVLIDISMLGCKLEMAGVLHLGSTVLVRLDAGREVAGTVVWSRAGQAGVRFTDPLSEDRFAAITANTPLSVTTQAA